MDGGEQLGKLLSFLISGATGGGGGGGGGSGGGGGLTHYPDLTLR
jgi:hypothetical protein